MKPKVGSLKRSMRGGGEKVQETLALQWLRLGSSTAQGLSLAGEDPACTAWPKKREREKIQVSNIRNKEGLNYRVYRP